MITDEVRDAAESIIGNLDEDGYLSASLDEIASIGEHTPEQVEQGLRVVQSLDPAGVGARNLRECLLLQIESVNGRGGVAWQIVSNSPAPAGNPAVQGNRQSAGAAASSTSRSPSA